jgi:hypothetical protein
MIPSPFERYRRAVQRSRYRRRESELVMLLTALRLLESRARLAEVRRVLGSKRG